jgi:hypothetical protein
MHLNGGTGRRITGVMEKRSTVEYIYEISLLCGKDID